MIWVTGCNGMLGSEIGKLLTQKKIPWVGSDKEVDVTNPDALESFAQSHDQSANRTGYTTSKKIVPGKITWVINCAAFTDVNAAEDNPELAAQVNTDGALNVARTTRKIGAKLIHLSTSCVFDGKMRQPYTENSPKSPISVYGKTKLDGENAIQKEMTQYYILRTSWLYGTNGTNFVRSVIQDASTKEILKISNDMAGSPTSAENLAQIILKIIETSENATSLFGKNSALPYGIYHYTDQGAVTRLDFAKKIYDLAKKYRRLNTNCAFEVCTSDELLSERHLPDYTVLDCSRIYSGMKFKVPTWDSSLEKFIKAGIQQASL